MYITVVSLFALTIAYFREHSTGKRDLSRMKLCICARYWPRKDVEQSKVSDDYDYDEDDDDDRRNQLLAYRSTAKDYDPD